MIPYLLFSNTHDGSGAIKVAFKLKRREEAAELIDKPGTEKEQIEQEVKLYLGEAE